MSTDIDWRRELDSSFGDGSDRPAADYLVPGRAALRRRRTAVGAAVLASVIVIGGIGWAAAPGDQDVRGNTIASDAPSPSITKAPKAAGAGSMAWDEKTGPARVNPGTGLEIREGAIVHDRRDDLYPGKDTESVALDISFEGKRWWMALEWDEGGSTFGAGPAGDSYDSFDAFVAASTSGGGMSSPEPDPVADKYIFGRVVNYGPDGVVELRPGATIVRRVDNPHKLAAPEKSVGLIVEFQGETTWLSLTAGPAGAGGTSEDAAESGWTDFDQWLAADVALQAGDPGPRLVGIDDEGVLTPAEPGVEILEQQADPDLQSYGTGAAIASAVAMVSWEDETWFVLVVRHSASEDAVITFAASKADGASTLDEFIAFAAARADGEGLR